MPMVDSRRLGRPSPSPALVRRETAGGGGEGGGAVYFNTTCNVPGSFDIETVRRPVTRAGAGSGRDVRGAGGRGGTGSRG